MIKPNFAAMSNEELKTYVLQHRDDDDALHELTVRVKTQGKRLNSIKELKQVIQEKRCLRRASLTPQQT
jgi:alkyl sulfatase BDS1-like metallo-beta-lactamase superfamily hydrolase